MVLGCRSSHRYPNGHSKSLGPLAAARNVLRPMDEAAYFMPTGTFLTFQLLAPLTTLVPDKNGTCGIMQYVLTGVFLGIMLACCFLMSFTDSITDAGGRIRYGIVTRKGLWWAGVRQEYGYPPGEQPVTDEEQAPNRNGQHQDALLVARPIAAAGDDNSQQPTSPWDFKYTRTGVDWAHASISVLTFLTLSMLTPPVSTCFFGARLSPNIALAVPILMGILASVIFNLIGAPRKGIGFPGQDLAN